MKKIRIIQAFPDGVLRYDCSKCGGVCCNLNASLVFDEESFRCLKEKKYIEDYIINYENGNVAIYCGKKCWFLKDCSCSLEQAVKPIGCKLYPINIWRLDDERYVAEIVPCPVMEVNKMGGIKLRDYNDFVIKYIRQNQIKKGIYSNRIELNGNLCWDQALANYLCWKQEYIKDIENSQNPLDWLFVQLPINPVLLNAPTIDIKEVYRFYKETLLDISEANILSDTYNKYIVLRNKTIEFVLFKYYFPSNHEKGRDECTVKQLKEIVKDRNIIWQLKTKL